MDGSVINDVLRQLAQIPDDASHLVISAGGNDLLFEIGVLQEPVRTVGEGLRLLAELRKRFDSDYRRLLEARPESTVCRSSSVRSTTRVHRTKCSSAEVVEALALFDDCIIGNAREFGFPVIDLRAVCTEIADFANPIEPSSAGGAKIAQAICDVVLNVDFCSGRTVLYPSRKKTEPHHSLNPHRNRNRNRNPDPDPIPQGAGGTPQDGFPALVPPSFSVLR